MFEYHCSQARYAIRLLFAILGVFIGFSACISFALVFNNYHCSAWAFVSGVIYTVVLILHIKVRKDVNYTISPSKFSGLFIVGSFGVFLGVSVFAGYLVKGILERERGVQVHGWFIVTIWGWFTFKSAFILMYFSKKYRQRLQDVAGDTNSDVNPLVYDA